MKARLTNFEIGPKLGADQYSYSLKAFEKRCIPEGSKGILSQSRNRTELSAKKTKLILGKYVGYCIIMGRVILFE